MDFEYEYNEQIIEEKLKEFGYFVLMSSDLTVNAEETLEKYRLKDVVEKVFYDLKDNMDRLLTESSSTTEGKIFVLYLGLIIKSHLRLKLGKYMKDKNLTFEDVLYELRKIKVYTINNKIHLASALTKVQKDIFELIGLEENDLAEYLETLT